MDGPRPTRKPDHEFFGDGCVPTDEVRAFNEDSRVERIEVYIEAMPDDAYPTGWWAALVWLKEQAVMPQSS